MPKINVYLPDELAEAVKESGVPVSAVCQRALEQAVRRVTAIRQTVLADVDWDQPSGALTHLTQRARAVLKLAADRAGAEGAASVGTEHLLAGMLAEGGNLALRVLEAMDIDVDQVARDLARHLPTPEPAAAGSATSEPATSGSTTSGPAAAGSATSGSATSAPATAGPRTFSGAAANALEFAVTEATSLGHNYVGCEHLLLGMVAEPDGSAGQVLRALGADSRLTRRAVTAALAGYVHLRAQAQQQSTPAPGQGQGQAQVQALLAAAIRNELQPLVQRLERLEERVGTDT